MQSSHGCYSGFWTPAKQEELKSTDRFQSKEVCAPFAAVCADKNANFKAVLVWTGTCVLVTFAYQILGQYRCYSVIMLNCLPLNFLQGYLNGCFTVFLLKLYQVIQVSTRIKMSRNLLFIAIL